MVGHWLSKAISNELFILFAALFTIRNIIESILNPKKNPYSKGKEGRFSLSILVISFLVSGISTGYFLIVTERVNLYFHITGLLIFVAAFLMRRVSINTLGDSYNYSIEIGPENQLVTSGVYSLVRHPIYLFYIVEMIAFLFIRFNYISLITLILVIVTTFYRINREDKLLAAVFKKEFETYRNKTKKLIPFIY